MDHGWLADTKVATAPGAAILDHGYRSKSTNQAKKIPTAFLTAQYSEEKAAGIFHDFICK
ncbi:hypothetical protein [Paenibacillus sp. 1-18]|uniref:hypothetical protein n=1 Tax=Paenibacillus sp. 1-18 TaxID=1333846 RepID=UPI00046F34FD|nr:hypothetical protein [Paenibacillus sp. 1-18]